MDMASGFLLESPSGFLSESPSGGKLSVLEPQIASKSVPPDPVDPGSGPLIGIVSDTHDLKVRSRGESEAVGIDSGIVWTGQSLRLVCNSVSTVFDKDELRKGSTLKHEQIGRKSAMGGNSGSRNLQLQRLTLTQ